MNTENHLKTQNHFQYIAAALGAIPIGIAIFDAQTLCLLSANALFHSFLDPTWQDGRAIGYPLTTWLPEAEKTGVASIYRTVAKTGVPFRGGEYVFPAFERGMTYWNCTLDPVRDNDGHIVQLVLTATDVTAQVLTRQKAEQDKAILEQANNEKEEFLSIASHELRTPITAIQGFAEILQTQAAEEQRLSPQSMRAITFIYEQSQCLMHLIEEMLDIRSIENAQLQLDIASHDLVSTIAYVVETLATAAPQHKLQFVLEGLQPTDKLMGEFDENRIVQVLNNLISNAVKYSSPGSNVEVGLRYSPEDPDDALIWVKDYGIGIAAHELSHIFKLFHRISQVNSSISGLGIGLYLVHQLVTRHGGRVWVESAEKCGSTFYVRLPLHTHRPRCSATPGKIL